MRSNRDDNGPASPHNATRHDLRLPWLWLKRHAYDRTGDPSLLAVHSLPTLIFPKVFPKGMKMAPGEVSEGRFRW